MRRRDLRLVVVATFAWATALLCVFVETIAGVTAALLWSGALGLLAWSWARRRRMPHVTLGTLAVGLAICAGVATAVAFAVPERATLREHDGRVIGITADITSALRAGHDGRLWFDAQVITAEIPDRAPRDDGGGGGAVRIGVEVPEAGAPEGWEMGARVRVRGQAKESSAGQRAAIVVFGRGAVEVVHPAHMIFRGAGEVRRQFLERAVRLPEPGAGLLPGLAVGDTRAVGDELNRAMLASGLSHLTAVSGANCAIVVGAVYGLVALCRGGRSLRIVLAGVALAAFVILVTPEPSVVRAATMAGLGMLTLLLGRPAAGVSVLSLAVALLLITDPWLAATPGFALSVAATAALIILARPVARGLARWVSEPIAIGVAVPLAAQLACGPVLALFAEQQSVVGVAANMIAAPTAPIATVIGLLACLALPVPLLADFFAASAWLPAAWIATTAQVSAQVPGAFVLIRPGIGSALVVTLVTAAATVLIVRGRYGGRPGLVLRWMSAGVLAVAVGSAFGALLLRGPIAKMAIPDGWSIAACDVGQGDAVLIRSAGAVALIDTGPDPEALRSCLRELGISRIDLLVLTHFDLDHSGGTEAILGRVETVLYGPFDGRGEEIIGRLAESGTVGGEGYVGRHGTLGDTVWRVLWPPRDGHGFTAGNDTSIAMEFSGGGVPRSLFLGDLPATAQRPMVALGAVRGPYDVVKLAHHGSRDQEPALYRAAAPAVALVSVGENKYGHPHPDALAMVGSARVLRTDTQGRVLLGLDDEGLRVWPQRSE